MSKNYGNPDLVCEKNRFLHLGPYHWFQLVPDLSFIEFRLRKCVINLANMIIYCLSRLEIENGYKPYMIRKHQM